MTKADLIKKISASTEVDKEITLAIVEEFMTVVKKAVAEGDDVMLRGFGVFKNVLRHEKRFHYAPGKYKVIQEHYEVVLRYYEDVKEAVK